MGRGSMSPLSLLIFSQRFMEGNESPKTSTTSLRLMPRSTASNTFSLSSLGYAFMPASIRKAQPKCNPPLGGTVGGSAILAKSLRTPPQVHLTKKQSIEVGIMVEPSRPSSLLVAKSTLRWYRTPLGKLARLGLLLAEKIP
jgi:hypothetical protein